jgi:glucose-6-phosphate 1-dehydrogenase
MSGPTADTLVLFGITGDLSELMLLPALYELEEAGQLDVAVVGVALADYGDEGLRRRARDAVRQAHGRLDEDVFARFARRLSLVPGDLTDPATYERLRRATAGASFLAHYLAIPPGLFAAAAEGIAAAGLATHARLAVEKPFGHDLASARELNTALHRCFPEERVFRVDHFLGKEPIEDITVLRFANSLLESVWNRSYVTSVQLTFAETLDVADRGRFYDAVGALRDVVQNHLLQVLCYLAMEPPVSGTAEAVRDEKVRLLRAVRAAEPDDVVRGQYQGYRDVDGVREGSTAETYVALRLAIDNPRWADVPFLIRTGKCLPTTSLEAVLELRQPPRMLFAGPETVRPAANLIRLRLERDAGVTLCLLARRYGGEGGVTQPVTLKADFAPQLGTQVPPYVQVLGDVIEGDTRHFARQDTVEEAWRIVEPVLDLPDGPLPYRPGTWGPAAADRLTPGGAWYPLEVQD